MKNLVAVLFKHVFAKQPFNGQFVLILLDRFGFVSWKSVQKLIYSQTEGKSGSGINLFDII